MIARAQFRTIIIIIHVIGVKYILKIEVWMIRMSKTKIDEFNIFKNDNSSFIITAVSPGSIRIWRCTRHFFFFRVEIWVFNKIKIIKYIMFDGWKPSFIKLNTLKFKLLFSHQKWTSNMSHTFISLFQMNNGFCHTFTAFLVYHG